MKKKTKRFLCVILTLFLLGAFLPAVSGYKVSDVTEAALELIYKHEGTYTSVVSNDNGAVSLGKVGWHGTRALNLMKTIVNSNKAQALSMLGENFVNEILTASQWDTRIFTDTEKQAAQKLLGTDESKKAQDELAYTDIGNYINHGMSLGITSGKALVFFADVENQCGSGVSARIAEAVKGSAEYKDGLTLDNLFKASLADKTAGSSETRRNSAYTYCKALSFSGDVEKEEFSTGKYITTASYLRFRKGPGTQYDEAGSSLPYGTRVTVTRVSGDWGQITCGGVTGWINLLYAEPENGSASGSEDDTAPVLIGDVNGSGKVEASDARKALRASAKLDSLTADEEKRADADGDGKITAKDARLILRAAAKLEELN